MPPFPPEAGDAFELANLSDEAVGSMGFRDTFAEKSGFLDPSGNPTSEYSRFVTSDTGEQFGLVPPKDDGFFREFGQSFTAGLVRTRRGFAKTFGAENAVNSSEFWLANRPQLNMPSNVGIRDPGWWGHVSGSATADSLPLLVGSALGGIAGPVAGSAALFGGSFARTFGDIGDEIRADVGDKVSEEDIVAAQIFETFVSSLIETSLGVEALLGRQFARTATLGLLRRAGGMQLMRNIARRGTWRLAKGVSGFALSAVGEGTEEVLQRLTHDVVTDVLADKKFSTFDEFANDFLAGTAGGFFLTSATGVLSLANDSIMRKLKKPEDLSLPEAEQKIHSFWRDGRLEFDEESRQLTDGRFAALAQIYRSAGKFTEQDIESLVTTQRTQAYIIAAEKGIRPEQMIDTLQIAFAPENLTEHDMQVLRGLKGNSEASLAYLNRRFKINQHIQTTLTGIDTSRLLERNDGREQTESRLSEEERTELNEKVARAITVQEEIAQREAGVEPIEEPTEPPAVIPEAPTTDEGGVIVFDEATIFFLENQDAVKEAARIADETIQRADRPTLEQKKVEAEQRRQIIGEAVERITEGPLTDEKIQQSLDAADEIIARFEARQGLPVKKREFQRTPILSETTDAEFTEIYVNGVKQASGDIVRANRNGDIITTPAGAGELIGQGRAQVAVEAEPRTAVETERAVRGELAPEPGEVTLDTDVARAREQARDLAFQNRQQRREEAAHVLKNRVLFAERAEQPLTTEQRNEIIKELEDSVDTRTLSDDKQREVANAISKINALFDTPAAHAELRDTVQSVFGFVPQALAEQGAGQRQLTAEERTAAAATSRVTGSIGPRALTPRHTSTLVGAGSEVLNYGAGKVDNAGVIPHSETLSEAGANVTNHDLPANQTTGVHDPDALTKTYDVVMASNVLNVQPDEATIRTALSEIASATKADGKAVFNFPSSPRFSEVSPARLAEIASEFFSDVKRVGGTVSAPLFEASGQGGEQFTFGQDIFDINTAVDLIEKEGAKSVVFSPEETPQLRLGFVFKDKNTVSTADISKPIILATTEAGSFVIDGHHRVERAIKEGKGIKGFVLSLDQSKIVKGETSSETTVTPDAFHKLAAEQRNAPEDAMEAAQFAMGGGIANPLIEDVGDLLHRMNARGTFDQAGYENVKTKVKFSLRKLRNILGFMDEFDSNLAGNAKATGVSEAEFREGVREALRNYADEHSKLEVFNEAQRVAQAAAVALGKKQWAIAKEHLETLDSHLGSEAEWKAYAHEGLAQQRIAFQEKAAKQKQIAASYFADHNLAVFYSSADVGTILHEWMHHLALNDLLPNRMQRSLRLHFQPDNPEMWQEQGLEDLSNSIIVFIRDGTLPEQAGSDLRQAFAHLKQVFAKTYQRVLRHNSEQELKLDSEVESELNALLGEVAPSELASTEGDALHTAMLLGPDSNGEVIVEKLNESGERVLFQLRNGERLDRTPAQLGRSLHAIMARQVGQEASHQAVLDLSLEVLGKEYKPSEFSVQEMETLVEQARNDLGSPAEVERQNRASMRQLLLSRFDVENESSLEPEKREIFDRELEYLTSPSEGAADINVQESINALNEQMDSLPDAEPMRARAGKGPPWYQRTRNALKRFGRAVIDNNFQIPANLIYYLNGYKADGAWNDHVGKVWRAGWNESSRLMTEDEKWIAKRRNELKLKEIRNITDKRVVFGKQKWDMSVGEIVYIAMLGRNPNQANALVESNDDVTRDMIPQAAKFVKDNEQLTSLVTLLDALYARMHKKAAPIYLKINNKPLGFVKGYAPMQRENNAYAANDFMDQLIATIAPQMSESVRSRDPRFKQRTQIKGSRISISDPITVALSYVSAVNNYVGKIENITALKQVLNGLRDKMREKYGDDMHVWHMLNKFSDREMFPAGRLEPLSPGEIFLKDARNRFQNALLGFRLATMPKQAVSLSHAMSLIPGGIRNIPLATQNGLELLRIMAGNRRSEIGEQHKLSGHPVFELLQKHNPAILRRYGEAEIEEINAAGARGLGKKIKVNGKALGVRALEGLRDWDAWTVGVSWYTAFQVIRDAELAKNPSNIEAAETKAAEFASDVVDRTQPASIPFQRSFAETGREYLRAMIPFSGQRIRNFNEYQSMLGAMADAMKDGGLAGVGKALFSKRAEYDTPLVQKAMWGAALPAVAMFFLMYRRPPNDDEYAKMMIMYPLTSIPILGPTLTFSMMYEERDPSFTPVYLQMASDLIAVMSDVFTDEVDLKGKTGRDLLRAIAEWTAFPDVILQLGRELGVEIVDGFDIHDITVKDIARILQLRIAD